MNYANKTSQINDFFFDLAHYNGANSAKSMDFYSIWRKLEPEFLLPSLFAPYVTVRLSVNRKYPRSGKSSINRTS